MRKKGISVLLNIFIIIIVSVFGIILIDIKDSYVDEKYTLFNANFLNDESDEAIAYKEEISSTKETMNMVNDNHLSEDNFDNLFSLNNDFVGYLKVSGTSISYPVVQAGNNDYYLKHSFDNTNNSYGWIYMDYRNNNSNLDRNTIIYGHSIKSNQKILFGELRTILNNGSDYVITYRTSNKTYKFQVFSVYSIAPESYYLTTKFTSSVSYNLFLNTIINRSVRNYGINVSSSDKIITLSTCYTSSERLVVHAKLIN